MSRPGIALVKHTLTIWQEPRFLRRQKSVGSTSIDGERAYPRTPRVKCHPGRHRLGIDRRA
jgi:hypothetical protein